MFYHNINPVLLELGPVEIRYYGLIYALAFVITFFMLKYFSKTKRLGLTHDQIDELIFYLILGVVIGARIFYVIFYNFSSFLQSPLSIFAVWQGGLSFHGGLAGMILATWIFARKHKKKFYHLTDLLTLPAAIALALGRIGNFINGELVGRVTDVPWSVKFKGYEGFRHPSQLYESAKNVVIFATLWVLKDKTWKGEKLPDGFLSWMFVLMYAVLRFFIEFVREPDIQLGFFFGWMTMGQILNVAMFIIALIFILRLKRGS